MSRILGLAGYGDSDTGRPLPMMPGGIRYGRYSNSTYKSDYLPEMDWQSAPLERPSMGAFGAVRGASGTGGWWDDLVGGAGTAASDSVSQAITAQVPAIVAATVSSPAFQSQVNRLRTEAIVGGLVLGALIVGGVYLTKGYR